MRAGWIASLGIALGLCLAALAQDGPVSPPPTPFDSAPPLVDGPVGPPPTPFESAPPLVDPPKTEQMPAFPLPVPTPEGAPPPAPVPAAPEEVAPMPTPAPGSPTLNLAPQDVPADAAAPDAVLPPGTPPPADSADPAAGGARMVPVPVPVPVPAATKPEGSTSSPEPAPVQGIPLEGPPLDGVPVDGPPVDGTPAPPGPRPAESVACQAACGCRFYGSLDVLLWSVKQDRVPPLLTTGPSSLLSPGALGAPGTVILLGGAFANDQESGGRFTAGYWLNAGQTFALEGEAFFLRQRATTFLDSSLGGPNSLVLSRPFFDVTRGVESTDPVALPNVQAGAIDIVESSSLAGAEIDLRANLYTNSWVRVCLLGGGRFLDLNENLGITESTLDLPRGSGNLTLLADRFNTRNDFGGFQVGADGEFWWGRWSLDLWGKFALGLTHAQVQISGEESITDPAHHTSFFTGGLLALPTNSGSFSQVTVTMVNEVGLRLGYQMTPNLRVFLGTSILSWSGVTRPGNAIDLGVNPSQFAAGSLSGPARPAFLFSDTQFWAGGFDFGLQIRF